MFFLDIGHVDVYLVINIHPNVDILLTHQYEKLYMMEDASPVIDIHPNVDILSTHQYEKLYMMEDASGGTQTSSCYGVSHSEETGWYLHMNL